LGRDLSEALTIPVDHFTTSAAVAGQEW
jgi:hypothetical protein